MSNELIVMLTTFGIMTIISIAVLYFFAKKIKKGLGLFVTFANNHAQQYNHWQRTSATIIVTDLIIEHSGSSLDSDGLGSSSFTSYKPYIEYKYQIDGREYTGNNLAVVLVNNATREDVERFLLDYQIGKPVIINYDPNNPEISSIFIKLKLPHDKTNRGPMFMKDLTKEL
ncbi:MAG: DUF3592 domain-containing protein [Gammaproteobacteria bacterium]|nr:DUF3592 domain-containing protein [Gammaproteobacteria bacterium]